MTVQGAAPGVHAYPDDPANLFVLLHDALPDDLFLGWEVTRWNADQELRRLADDVADAVLDKGVADTNQIEEIVKERGDAGRFAILRGLDFALAHVNPFSPAYDYGELAYILTRYVVQGQFNDKATTDGVLLPRCTYPGRPRGKKTKGEFFGLNRISAGAWEGRLRLSVLETRYDPNFSHDEKVAVGCAPILATVEDVSLVFERQSGVLVYRLKPVDSGQLRERIAGVVEKLDHSGARIAVMPEASLSDDLLDHWREVVRATASRDKTLRWLFIGTGPLGESDPPSNRAVLIDRMTGDILLEQDKLSNFTLTAEQARDWCLPGGPSQGAAEEYITQGSKTNLVDSSMGRMAILICEDLSRSVGWEREFLSAGVSHLFVPIFSKPILEYRWEQQAAEQRVTTLGSWAVVSNSLVVDHAMRDNPLEGVRHTCLVAGPADLLRTRHAPSMQFGTAASAGDLGLVGDGADLPTVRTGAVYDEWFENSIDQGTP